MSIRFGEIPATQILDNEFRIRVLEKLFDNLRDVEKIRRQVVGELQKKYPNSGIELTEERSDATGAS